MNNTEVVKDPKGCDINYNFMIKRGVSYPNQLQLVLGMRFDIPEQLKLILANYGVANGFQLSYMGKYHKCVLVYCGRDMEGGRCG
ncbi:hypothetical protein Tco_1388490, partial [Tanacetum coccineum]